MFEAWATRTMALGDLSHPRSPGLLTRAVAPDFVPARRFTPHILGSGTRVGKRLIVENKTPPGMLPGWGPLLFDDERSHHVVFFVVENVAMPHVLFSPCSRANRITDCRRRQPRQVKLHDHSRDFSRVHPHRVRGRGSLRCTSKVPLGDCYSAVTPCTRITTPRIVIDGTDASDENHGASTRGLTPYFTGK
jgi:hypothetical protein